MKHRYLPALAMIACVTTAQADVNSAVVRFSPFTITATDLNVLDGIAPAYAFTSALDTKLTFLIGDDAKDSTNASEAWSQAGEQLGATFGAAGIELAHTGAGQPNIEWTQGNGIATIKLAVAPNTRLTLSGLLQMAAAVDCTPSGTEFCNASGSFLMSFALPAEPDIQTHFDNHYYKELYQSVDAGNSGVPQPPATYSEQAQISFWNTTDKIQTTTLTFSGTVTGHNRSMVPEPATWGLVLAGLGCVLASRRRR